MRGREGSRGSTAAANGWTFAVLAAALALFPSAAFAADNSPLPTKAPADLSYAWQGAYFGGCEVSLLFFLSGGPDPVVCGDDVCGVDDG